MNVSSHFEIIVNDEVYSQFRAISPHEQLVILDAIECLLADKPMTQTPKRQPLRIPETVGATWELRCGEHNQYRVFYDVDSAAGIVVILALGIKKQDRLTIDEEEFSL